MSNRIDQLFKNKLSEHVLPPAEDTWVKVQNGLSKKNEVVIYWRAAAVLAVLGLVISAWYLLTKPAEISIQQISKTDENQMPDNASLLNADEKKSTISLPTENKAKKTNVTKPLAKREQSTIIPAQDALKETVKEPLHEEVTEIDEHITVASVAEKPIVIEFTLPTIEETATPIVSLIDSETEKSTGIKKFLETARDVKNGEAELGSSLRDIKNELFALEFKKDKTRRN
jgi:hypothetical protein